MARRRNADMSPMHNVNNICPSLCEKRLVFRLAVLLSEILFLYLFKPQQIRLELIFLLQIVCIPSKSVINTIKTISSPEGKNREGGLNRHRLRSGFVLHTSISNCMLGISFILALPQLQIEA